MPPIFNVAVFATVNCPPATVVPLFAVKVNRSKVPPFTKMFPVVEDDESSAGRFAANDFTVEPLMISRE